ncbi:MAG: RstR family transcriptional repressor [Bacteroidota bacterium]
MLNLERFNSNYYQLDMEFKDRLRQARKDKGISQNELAQIVGVHVTNISRYERGENKPTSQVLTKLGDALGISADFLMAGSTDEVADNMISDKELLDQFRRVELLPQDRKKLVKEFLDAFLIKTELKQKLSL